MASMAMSITASPQLVKRVSPGPLSAFGPGPIANGLQMSTKGKITPRLSMTVKAQGDLHRDIKADLTSDKLGDDLRDTSHFELTPWDYKEEANKIKMWFNMPGVAAQDIRVYVKDQKLFIQGKHLHLPSNIRKEDMKAKLGNGVLYVTMPKIIPDYESLPIVVEPVSW